MKTFLRRFLGIQEIEDAVTRTKSELHDELRNALETQTTDIDRVIDNMRDRVEDLEDATPWEESVRSLERDLSRLDDELREEIEDHSINQEAVVHKLEKRVVAMEQVIAGLLVGIAISNFPVD